MHRDAFISDLIDRLRQQVDEILPATGMDSLFEQVQRALRHGLADLELVPRRELEGHLAALRELRATVQELEQRIRLLESDPTKTADATGQAPEASSISDQDHTGH